MIRYELPCEKNTYKDYILPVVPFRTCVWTNPEMHKKTCCCYCFHKFNQICSTFKIILPSQSTHSIIDLFTNLSFWLTSRNTPLHLMFSRSNYIVLINSEKYVRQWSFTFISCINLFSVFTLDPLKFFTCAWFLSKFEKWTHTHWNASNSEQEKQYKNGNSNSNINRTKRKRTWPRTGSCKFQKT